jgi:hypothetical protein
MYMVTGKIVLRLTILRGTMKAGRGYFLPVAASSNVAHPLATIGTYEPTYIPLTWRGTGDAAAYARLFGVH